MNKDINLIVGKRKTRLQQHRTLNIVTWIARVFLGVVVISAVTLFFLNQNSGLEATNQKIAVATQTLQKSQQKILKLLLVQSRLKSIDTILKTRTAFEKDLGDVVTFLPADVVIDSANINKKNIILNLSSNSLSALNTFVDSVIAKMTAKQLYQKITIDSLIGDVKSGKYTLAIELQPL